MLLCISSDLVFMYTGMKVPQWKGPSTFKWSAWKKMKDWNLWRGGGLSLVINFAISRNLDSIFAKMRTPHSKAWSRYPPSLMANSNFTSTVCIRTDIVIQLYAKQFREYLSLILYLIAPQNVMVNKILWIMLQMLGNLWGILDARTNNE